MHLACSDEQIEQHKENSVKEAFSCRDEKVISARRFAQHHGVEGEGRCTGQCQQISPQPKDEVALVEEDQPHARKREEKSQKKRQSKAFLRDEKVCEECREDRDRPHIEADVARLGIFQSEVLQEKIDEDPQKAQGREVELVAPGADRPRQRSKQQEQAPGHDETIKHHFDRIEILQQDLVAYKGGAPNRDGDKGEKVPGKGAGEESLIHRGIFFGLRRFRGDRKLRLRG